MDGVNQKKEARGGIPSSTVACPLKGANGCRGGKKEKATNSDTKTRRPLFAEQAERREKKR